MDESTNTSADVIDVSAEVAQPEGQDVPQEAEKPAEGQPEATVEQPAETPKPASRSNERIRGLVDERNKLKAELEKALATVTEPKQPAAKQIPGLEPELAKHPGLAGLETTEDDEGNTFVKYRGQWVSPEFAAEQHDLRSQLETLAQTVASDKQAAIESRYEAQIAQAHQELQSTVIGYIAEVRGEAFPGLAADKSQLVDKYIINQSDVIITQKVNAGAAFDSATIEASVTEALTEAKMLFGIFGTKQVEDNQKSQQKDRVKPDGGQPGTPNDVPYDRMSEKDQRSFAQRLAASVNARLRSD